MNTQKYRVFIVDDHPLVREWLSHHINQQPDLSVCGEAENTSSALRGIDQLKPDLALVDISLEGGSGLDLIKILRISHPGVKILVLSMHDESLYGERAFRAGARGYLTKRETTKKVVIAMRQVLAGKSYMSDALRESMAMKFLEGRPTVSESPAELLSDRELEIFEMLGKGNDTRRISEVLNLSKKTVQAYYTRIKEKLGLDSARELLRAALQWHDRH